jgi:hypothetical protein
MEVLLGCKLDFAMIYDKWTNVDKDGERRAREALETTRVYTVLGASPSCLPGV